MLKQKTKLYSVIISSIIFSFLLGIHITNAAYNPIPRNLCTLMVKPYDPTASPTYGAAGDSLIKYLSSQICANHLDYPNAYSPQPPLDNAENQVKAGAENEQLPITRHDHIYYNDSVQDTYFYYKSFVEKFEITIESDGRNNLILDEIWCDTPVPFEYTGTGVNNLSDCSGVANDLYGGTLVTKQVTSNSIIITWNFATIFQNGSYLGRPVVWGNNGSSFPVHDMNGNLITLNLTDEDNRNLPFHVHLTTKNNNEKIWSATTTSRVLLADLAIRKSNYATHGGDGCYNNDVNSPNSGWCYLPPPSGYPTQQVFTTQNRTYYWFPIGSVATIWQKPTPPPPSNYCDDLDIIAPDTLEYLGGNTYRYTPNTEATFVVEPHFAGSGPAPPLDYRWNATEWNQTFTTGGQFGGVSKSPEFELVDKSKVNIKNLEQLFSAKFQEISDTKSLQADLLAADIPTATQQFALDQYGLFYDSKNVGTGQNPYVDEGNIWSDDRSTYYTGGPSGTLVRVEAVDANAPDKYAESAYVGNGCAANVIIYAPPETKECIDLDIYQDGAEVPSTLPVNSDTEDFYVQVSTDPSDWDLDFNWTLTTTGSATVDPSQTSNPGDLVDINGTITNGTELSVNAFESGDPTETPIPNCNDNLTFTENVVCDFLTITSSAGAPLDEGEGTVLTASGQFTDGSEILQVQYSADSGTFTPIDVGCSAIYGMDQNPITVAPDCAVIYTGGNAGEQITAVVPGYENVCVQTIDIVPTLPPACIDLELDPDSFDEDGSTSLTATVEFNIPGDYETTIVWDSYDTGTFDNNPDGYTQTETSNNSDTLPFNTLFDAYDPDYQSVEVYVQDAEGAAVFLPECSDALKRLVPPEVCEEITVECVEDGDEYQCCVEVVEGEYDGEYTWVIDGFTVLDETGICANIPADTAYDVQAKEYPVDCRFADQTPPPPREVNPPDLIKRARKTANGTWTTDVMTIQYNHEPAVYYRLTFESNADYTTATIIDTISENNGRLEGELLPRYDQVDPEDRANYPTERGFIEYIPGSMDLNIPHCNDVADPPEGEEKKNCYYGEIDNPNGVTLVNIDEGLTVEITYAGEVNSILTPEVCKEGIVCEEIYRNSAHTEDLTIEDEPYEDIYTDEIEIQIFCPYILTRAAGDVFLETALTSGIDIYQCSEYRGTTGIIVTPGRETTPELVKTGTGDTTMFSVSHEICSEGQAGTFIDSDLADLYGAQIFGNLSSQICEMRLRTGNPWKQEIVTNSIDENKTRISRWFPDFENDTNISWLRGSDQSVFRIKDGDLIIDVPYELKDGPTGGAKTFIIEDGDLIINEDILYGACEGTCSVREVASLAFIVLNGNIYIDDDVETISGVFFVQEGEDEGTGRLFSYDSSTRGFEEKQSDKKLKVLGSIYGDIDPLFSKRIFAGDPGSDEGGIVIRFDQRIILNTPPGLRDILSLSQIETAR
jgi:hypothetical protein